MDEDMDLDGTDVTSPGLVVWCGDHHQSTHNTAAGLSPVLTCLQVVGLFRCWENILQGKVVFFFYVQLLL